MNEQARSFVGYLYSDRLRAEANRIGRNYWYAYLPEIFDEMGLRATELSLDALENVSDLAGYKYLFAGSMSLNARQQEVLREWVRLGGILIGFALKGADDLFGISHRKTIAQPDDEFTISGYGKFSRQEGDAETSPDPMYDYRGALLPIFSPLEMVAPGHEAVIEEALLLNAGRTATGCPSVVRTQLEAGKTWYFAFDLTQTIWVMHQGRPIDRDYDGDGYYRTGDAIPFSRLHDLEVPYGDYWLQYLEEILSSTPQPFIHQLPPLPDGSVPDLLIHFGGDDECTPGIQVEASRYMKALGLPYHMNLMPVNGKFAIDRQEYEIIKNNGHDLSIHFDFVKPHFHYTEADVLEQIQMYTEAFGEVPIASVNHWCTGTGWAEHARWASSGGMKGDNSRAHAFNPPYNPINLMGYGFGTVYPHFVYDDFKHDNARIPFVNIPIGFFEPRIYEESKDRDIARIQLAVERAAYFGWTLNMFIHPVYISDAEHNMHCLPALEELLRYLNEKQFKVKYHSTNQLCLWWMERASTRLEHCVMDAGDGGSTLSFEVETQSSDGVLVKIPLNDGNGEAASYSLDGQQRAAAVHRQNGRCWIICHVPRGEHRISVTLPN
jgi:hypothetical protein